MWLALREEIAEMFARFHACFDCRSDHLGLRIFSAKKDDPSSAAFRARAWRRMHPGMSQAQREWRKRNIEKCRVQDAERYRKQKAS